ncbi:hypothetical protein OJ998_34895 [Solirubrobacter taibaiensis]|nr:hypothetical protein [Solirubrobacter taibaiensis]
MPLAARVTGAIEAHLSPAGTRRATLFERLTVCRLPWATLVRVNAWLAALGKLATSLYCAVIAAFVIGFDFRPTVQSALNSGRPIEHVAVLVILIPTVIFLLARSMISYGRWKVQRELWRRDVERLGGSS